MSFSLLCLDLQAYIRSLDYTNVRKDAYSLQLYRLIATQRGNDIITFNYSDLTRLDKRKPKCSIEYIHGNIDSGIILGFQRFGKMAPGYEYMTKVENSLYKFCHVYEKMMAADEVIIFGHSLGNTDHYYFQKFFDKQASDTALSNKMMTLFTLNRQSKESIVRQLVTLSNGRYGEFIDNTKVKIIETENNEAELGQYLDGLRKRMKKLW